MKIHTVYEDDHLLVVSKPVHLPTHAPDPNTDGLVEILCRENNTKLGVHQRLDAETSGVIAFSKSQYGAQLLSKSFELRTVKKIYRALVCGSPKTKNGQWIHTLAHEKGITFEASYGRQAKSRFRIIKNIGPFSLIELELLTGITHQLRVQCALEGCPILGDSLYGGGDFAPRMYLHAASLRLNDAPNLPTFHAPLPDLLDKPSLYAILQPLLEHARRSLEMLPDTEAIRLIVPQHSGIPEVMVEKLANHLLIRHIEPELSSLWTVPTLKTLIDSSLKAFNCKDCAYRVHTFSKKIHACAALEKALAHDISAFDATENNLIYTFDLSGNATGLYLDQRDNRIWIKNHAHGSVLNLFAYTCAFSLCAASSEQVTSTTSVDAAPAALQRGKLNFERNRISTDGHRFITEDALKYLAKCERNQVTFDTVICDPPSFGRFNKTVFSLENDMQDLLELCLKVASPGAVLLFSINHRKIHLQKLKSAWKQAVGKLNIQVKSVQIFTNDDATGPLGVGTDLKTIRAFL